MMQSKSSLQQLKTCHGNTSRGEERELERRRMSIYTAIMRRSDREVTDLQEIGQILEGSTVCRVAFSVDNAPYIVPLSYGYDPETQSLYFHTADGGKKIDCIARNPRVCFEVEGEIRLRTGGRRGCRWTVAYESVVGYGTISEVCGSSDKEKGLRFLMDQHSPDGLEWTFGRKMVETVRVWRLKIDVGTVRGKRAR